MTRRQRRITKESLMFAVGLGGVIAVTIWSLRDHRKPDATLLLVFTAMLGLHLSVLGDSKGHDDGDSDRERRARGRDDDDE